VLTELVSSPKITPGAGCTCLVPITQQPTARSWALTWGPCRLSESPRVCKGCDSLRPHTGLDRKVHIGKGSKKPCVHQRMDGKTQGDVHTVD
jgi:hypothetical protein